MKKTNEELDDLIQAALAEESDLKGHYADLPLIERTLEIFRGRERWLYLLTAFIILVFAAILFYAAYRFLATDLVPERLLWLGVFLFSSLAILMIKLMQWMEIGRRSVQREVKRLELQVALLRRDLLEREEN